MVLLGWSATYGHNPSVAIETSLQAELTTAMRRRDAAVVAVLRTTLAALANAEAAPLPEPDPESSSTDSVHVAGATCGLGATEVQRRTLTNDDRRSIVASEAAELAGRVEHLTRLRRRDEADGARRGLQVLGKILDEPAWELLTDADRGTRASRWDRSLISS